MAGIIRPMQGLVGRSALAFLGLASRARNKLFTRTLAGAFAGVGPRSTIAWPARFSGLAGVEIGADVFLGPGSWLQTLPTEECSQPRIVIGDRVSAAGALVLSAAQEIVLEEAVLLARNVYIADHIHRYDRPGVPVLDQGVTKVAPIRIGAGSWMGQNVVICPGARIGEGSVIGANSVVNSDVPARCLAVGSPARVVRRI